MGEKAKQSLTTCEENDGEGEVKHTTNADCAVAFHVEGSIQSNFFSSTGGADAALSTDGKTTSSATTAARLTIILSAIVYNYGRRQEK